MEEDEGVYLNAHSSSTQNLYPDWAGETVSRQLHTLNTNTPVHIKRIQYFSYYHGNRLTHTCKKKQFTEKGINLPNHPNTSIVTLGHYNIQAIVKGVLVLTSITPQTTKLQSPELHQGYSNVQVNKLTLKSSKNLPKKPIKNKDKGEVDVSLYIMHWGLNTNQISASKWELSHSAKIIISVMQNNMVNRARDGVKSKRSVSLRPVLRNSVFS